MSKPLKIAVIPDIQDKPGVPKKFLTKIGNYLAYKKPDVIVCMGDFSDVESLSSYDKGTKKHEGKRYKADLKSADDAMVALMVPIVTEPGWHPRLVMLMGNHEKRADKAANSASELDGTIGTADFRQIYESFGWEVHDFLEVVTINGVAFSHYFTSGVMGRPVTSAAALLSKKHMSCIAGHQQGKQIAYATRADGATITGMIVGSCMAPHHKVLTADLRYVPLGDIKAGDKLVSFDEGGSTPAGSRNDKRRFKTGTVLAVRMSRGEMFDVTLSSGKVFRVTADHRWFTKDSGSKYSWLRTDQLRCTKVAAGKGGGTRIVRLIDEFEHNQSWQSGWLAGMYCGEGSLYHRKTTGGSVAQLALSQSETRNPGTCRRIEAALSVVCGVEVDPNQSSGREVNGYRIKGGARQVAKVLGTIRPPRMLDKWTPEMLGSLTGTQREEQEHFVSIEPVGVRDYVEIDIDAKTMVVEGYGHHNCYEHDEDYLGPQGNKHWRGLVMLHEVKDGSFDEMFVSLDYINKKYPDAPTKAKKSKR